MVDGLIKINNKEYFLKFTINSLCEMKECGLDVMKLDETMDFTQIRSLFYFGLKKIHGQEIKSVEQAGDLMRDMDFSKRAADLYKKSYRMAEKSNDKSALIRLREKLLTK